MSNDRGEDQVQSDAENQGGDILPESEEQKPLKDGDFLDPLMEEMDTPNSGRDLESVYDIPIKVSAVLGNARLKVKDVMKMRKGDVVELDRAVGDAIDIWVNNRLVARGEVVVVEERLGITMTEIIKTDKAQA
ncbi:MAG: flagellar motor switch protein FliN [Alphaproteobacteria bacterium]|nr:flagellar motor switch protein FliN [Alphaproteobacteria bacterium]